MQTIFSPSSKYFHINSQRQLIIFLLSIISSAGQHNFSHNNEWLTRSLRHHGRVAESVSLAKNMIELPRHPDYNTLDDGSANYGRRRLLETLSLYEQWQALVELTDTHYLDVSDEPKDRADRAHRLANSHAYLGNWESFEIERLALEEALAEAKAERVTEMEQAEDGVREEGGERFVRWFRHVGD